MANNTRGKVKEKMDGMVLRMEKTASELETLGNMYMEQHPDYGEMFMNIGVHVVQIKDNLKALRDII